LVFGVSERIDIDGRVIEAPKEEEIQFLISKLQFSQVKSVAICFLHSQLNPVHENWVAEKLVAAGFEVICSSETVTKSNEVARWWRAFSKLYLKATFENAMNETNQMFLKKGWDLNDLHWINKDPVDSFATRDRSMSKSCAESGHVGVIYAGFDSWKLISAKGKRTDWLTDLGPVHCERPETFELGIQPMMELSLSDYGIVAPSGLNLGLDPGPARWGRSLRPTVLDAILADDFHFANGIQALDPLRPGESLSALSRSSKMSKELIKDTIMDLIEDQFKIQLAKAPQGKWLLAGPLANIFGTRLYETGFQIDMDKNPEFISSSSVAKYGDSL
jgi:hypothetical protein